MSISGAMNVAVQGMMAQTKRIDSIANNVANMETSGYRRQSANLSALAGPSGGVQVSISSPAGQGASSSDPSNVDPLQEMTGLIEAENSFKANASVFEAGADMWDVLMSIKRDPA